MNVCLHTASRGHEPLRATGKVDSQEKSAAWSIKSRSHSRLPSFGRRRSRANFHSSAVSKPPASPGETATPAAPVSPSDAGSPKRSDTSTLSFRSSQTALSDDAEVDYFLAKETPSLLLSADNFPIKTAKSSSELADPERLQRPVLGRVSSMHQTSSKLLRMTDDERPFTRVCSTFSYVAVPCSGIWRCGPLYNDASYASSARVAMNPAAVTRSTMRLNVPVPRGTPVRSYAIHANTSSRRTSPICFPH